jgi:hypothetical protein
VGVGRGKTAGGKAEGGRVLAQQHALAKKRKQQAAEEEEAKKRRRGSNNSAKTSKNTKIGQLVGGNCFMFTLFLFITTLAHHFCLSLIAF